MTLTQFLALFPVFKETKTGWLVTCPAHEDRHPSMIVGEGEAGRILIHCRAMCPPAAICDSLGITEADLFQDRPLNGQARPLRTPTRKLSPRQRAFAYEVHAWDLRHRAQQILDASARCADCDTWTDADRELAMKAVSPAYTLLERARFCEDYADHLREVAYVAA